MPYDLAVTVNVQASAGGQSYSNCTRSTPGFTTNGNSISASFLGGWQDVDISPARSGKSVVSAPATNAPVVVDPAANLPAEVSLALADIGITGSATVRDLWNQKDLGSVTGTVSATVNSHGAVLLRIHPTN